MTVLVQLNQYPTATSYLTKATDSSIFLTMGAHTNVPLTTGNYFVGVMKDSAVSFDFQILGKESGPRARYAVFCALDRFVVLRCGCWPPAGMCPCSVIH